MAIDLVWDETIPHVVQYRFQRGWTWEEFRDTALKEHRWGEALNGTRYDVIGDLTHATLPTGSAFTHVVRLFNQGPQNRRMIVVVGSRLAQVLIDTGGRIYPRVRGRFHAADTLNAARQLILRLRDSTD